MGRAARWSAGLQTLLQRARRVALATLACFAAIGPVAAEASKPVTVMTRNVYLGGDFSRPLDATALIQDMAKAWDRGMATLGEAL